MGVHDGEVGVRGPLPQPAGRDVDAAGPGDGGVHAEFAQGQGQEAVGPLAVGAGQQHDQGVQGAVQEGGVEHGAVERGAVGQFEAAEGLPVAEPDLGEGAHPGAVVQTVSAQDVVAVGVGDRLGAAGGDGGRVGRCRALDGSGVDLAGRDHPLVGGEFEADRVALAPQLDQRGARPGGVGEQLLEGDSAQPDRSAEGQFACRAGQFQLSGGGQDGLGGDAVVGEVELATGAGAAVGEGVQGGDVLVQHGVRAGAGDPVGGCVGVRAGQPAAAALEGVRRQWDAAALLALEPGRPVDGDAGLPGTGHAVPGAVGHAEGDTARSRRGRRARGCARGRRVVPGRRRSAPPEAAAPRSRRRRPGPRARRRAPRGG
ncbi:hypothetical protein SVIOM74S_04203 [Streptomyces violarus]